ncbi:hypothetical protein PQX77_013245 [Marasmius sp. AFHP31]|nr:hypothetical protein PQX77_013245 [Marasmius sp. AFHP31]
MTWSLVTLLDTGSSTVVVPNFTKWTWRPPFFDNPAKPMKTSPESHNFYSCPVGPPNFRRGIYRDYGDVARQLGNRKGALQGSGVSCTGFFTWEEAEGDWAHICLGFHNDEEHQHRRALAKQQADNKAADAHAAVIYSAIEHLHPRLAPRISTTQNSSNNLLLTSQRLLRQTPPLSPSKSQTLQVPPLPSSSRFVRFGGALNGWVLYVGFLDGVDSYRDL